MGQHESQAMPKSPKFEPKKTPRGWCVNIPSTHSASGSRERSFFKTNARAEEFAKTLRIKAREHGRSSSAIRPSVAEDATRAAAILAPYKVSLTDAARFYAAERDKQEASCVLTDAAEAWLASCANLRPRSIQGYRATKTRLIDALGTLTMSAISSDELRDALMPSDMPATAAKGHYRNGKAFWRWASKRGWCEASVFDEIEAKKTRNDAEIEILTPNESKLLLLTAQRHFPDAVASYALGLFAGIRAEEINRLEAKHVTAEGIELPAEVTKKGRRRHITPNATLAAWLTAHPFKPCADWKRVDAACRCLAGWRVRPTQRLVKLTAKELAEFDSRPAWPQNALRHSHASYSVAIGASLESLLFEFGHAGGPAMLREHYVGRATKKAGLEFFQISPAPSIKIPKLKIA